MKELFRIKKGQVVSKSYKIPFYFGLIFENDGILSLELYVQEEFDFKEINRDVKKFFSEDFNISAFTEHGDKIEGTQLSANSSIPSDGKIIFTCFERISFSKITTSYYEKDNVDTRQAIFYLELEGIRMAFENFTEVIRARNGVKIDDFKFGERDHTTAILKYNGSLKPTCDTFNLTFFKNEQNDNIIISCPNWKENDPNVLYYDVFEEFKKDFVALISFLNGADVKIRKEYVGGFYNVGTVGAQTEIFYSFRTIKNERHNSYISLKNDYNKSSRLLGPILLFCFNNYIEENKKLDLNSIVFYLNGAEQLRSLEEKFFIQIIALERLAQKYIDNITSTNEYLIPDQVFNEIKIELLRVLENYSEKLGSNYKTIAGKVGELHVIKSTSTKYKFTKLLEYAKIDMNDDIKNLIEIVRHRTIHYGEIGDDSNSLKNSMILDKLLRDIILGVIGYKSVRKNVLSAADPF